MGRKLVVVIVISLLLLAYANVYMFVPFDFQKVIISQFKTAYTESTQTATEYNQSDTRHNHTDIQHNHTTSETTISNNSKTTSNLSSQNVNIQTKSRVMFLKTHKTATSTLINMYYLYGIRRRLNFVAKPYNHWLGEISQDIKVDALLKPRPGQQWEMQVTHGIFNADGEHQVLPKATTFYTTILRSPDTQFPSAFYYFGEEKRQRLVYGASLSKGELIDKYLEKRQISPTDHLSPALDLGWTHFTQQFGSSKPVQDRIDGFIKFLDDEMDLIMISERLDESLIVFKEYMGWDNEDILYLNRNVAPEQSKDELSDSTKNNLFKHLTLDKQMFDFFNASLDRHIDKLGRKHIEDQVREFRFLREEFEDKCFNKSMVKVMEWDTRSYELTEYGKTENLACTFLQLNDSELDNAISQLQNSRDYTAPIYYKGRIITQDYLFGDIIKTLQHEYESMNLSNVVNGNSVEDAGLDFRIPTLWKRD